MATDNHNFINPEAGEIGWHPDWYSNFEELDRLAELRGPAADRNTKVPKTGSKYLATDTEEIFLGGGSGWQRLTSTGKNPTLDSADIGTLEATTTDTEALSAESALTLPIYDTVSDAPLEQGGVIFASGVDDPVGVYRSDGVSWSRLGSGDGSGSEGGASSLSELTVDTSKNWHGYDISNVGALSADTVSTGEIDANTASVVNPPTLATDVVRLDDISDLAGTPHGNEAHASDYVSEADLGSVATDPHGNEAHSQQFATTTDVDGLADDPHGNEAHTTAFSETGHNHNGQTLRPSALETGAITATSIGGSVAGGATISDFAGENLYVSDGSLNAVGGSGTVSGKSHVEYVDIDDFGADPTGGSYSDSALSSAISALNDGDWLVMTQGNYRFRNSHTITNDYITVTGEGSQIVNENDNYGSSTSFLRFLGSVNSTSSPDTLNASTIQAGDQKVQVQNSSGFSVGDDILILERKSGASPHTGYDRSVAQTRSIIRAIDGNVIYLTRSSSYFHGSGNAGIWRIDACKRPRVYDMHMRSGMAENFLTFRFTRNGHMERCYTQNCTGFAYQLYYGFRDTLVDCVVKHPTYTSSRSASQQEFMRTIGGTDYTLVNPVVEDARRAIDINNGTHGLTIINPLITNAQLHGICFHNSGSDSVYGSYEVYGGRIEAKQDVVTNDLYRAGLCASLSPNQTHVKLVGTTLVGRSAAIHAPDYGNGNIDNVTLIGCTFETVPGYTGGELVRVGGSNWNIQNCTIRPNGSQPAIEQSGGGTRSGTRILGNHIEGDIDFSGCTVNGFWVKNNHVSGGISNPGGSGHYVNANN